MQEREEIINMYAIISVFLLLVGNASGMMLRVDSPHGEYSLLIKEKLYPEASDEPIQEILICKPDGEAISNLGGTVFPILAVKWHASKNAVMILSHISRQVVMEVIVLKGDKWVRLEIDQFDKPPDYFALIDARSAESSFSCYYIGSNERGGREFAYRTEVSIPDGKAVLKSKRKILENEIEFYKLSVTSILNQMGNQSKEKPPRYSSSNIGSEPEWFGIRN